MFRGSDEIGCWYDCGFYWALYHCLTVILWDFCAKNALLYRVGLRLHCFGNGCRFFGYAFYQTVI